MRARLEWTLGFALLLSCAPRPEPASGGADTVSARADSGAGPVDSAPTVTAAPPPPPDTASAAPANLGRLLLGTWDISPQGVAGPHLTLTVESADGNQFRGRLTRAFAGDVGLDPGQFRAFSGSVARDSVARVTIHQTAPGAPPVEIRGKVSRSTWRLSHFLWGGDQQVQRGITWTGRKVR